MDASAFQPHPELLDPPVKRAAYSDRTAWMMAVMSQLAYLPFEGPPDADKLRSIAETIASKPDVGSVVAALEALISASSGNGEGVAQLKTALGSLRFELIDTFSVTVPLTSDSQAFIARVSTHWRQDGANDYLIVSFRGTEPRKVADIKTDVRARLIPAPGVPEAQAKVHEGFYRALIDAPSGGQSIRDRIDAAIRDHPGLPVFVTGHSLGGALAVVATRYIANGSRGACYTFGQPRVGNQHFVEQIFTPVYRVVNAADIVPALPLNESAINFLIGLVTVLRFLPGPFRRWVVDNLSKIRGYRHGGDQRYLTRAKRHQAPEQAATYPDLKVYSTPSGWDRWGPSLPALITLQLSSLIGDHSIALYVEKLAGYAHARRALKHRLNPRKPQAPERSEPPADAGASASKPPSSLRSSAGTKVGAAAKASKPRKPKKPDAGD